MNKGLFHPFLNPEGCGVDINGDDWINTSLDFNNLRDCLDKNKVDEDSCYYQSTNPSINMYGSTSLKLDGSYNSWNIIKKRYIKLPDWQTYLHKDTFSEYDIFDSGHIKTRRGYKDFTRSDKMISTSGYQALYMGDPKLCPENAWHIGRNKYGYTEFPFSISGDYSYTKSRFKFLDSFKESNTAEGEDTAIRFGEGLASDDSINRIVVGGFTAESAKVINESTKDTQLIDTGAIYIMDWNETDNKYDLFQRIDNPDATSNSAYFGRAVAISNGYIAVGAERDDENGGDTGSVYIYKLNDTGDSYEFLQKIMASDGAASDYFGSSVAIDSEKLIVGAPNDNDGISDTGSIYIYTLDTGVFGSESKISFWDPSDRANTYKNAFFGISLALQGTKLAVGAFRLTAITPDEAKNSQVPQLYGGAVIFYEWDGTTFVKDSILPCPINRYDARFGRSIALHDNKLIVGAETSDTQYYNSGDLFYFEYNDSTNNYDWKDMVWIDNPSAFIGSAVCFANGKILANNYHHVQRFEQLPEKKYRRIWLTNHVYNIAYTPSVIQIAEIEPIISYNRPGADRLIDIKYQNKIDYINDSKVNNISSFVMYNQGQFAQRIGRYGARNEGSIATRNQTTNVTGVFRR